jgi:hydrogenase maturation protease
MARPGIRAPAPGESSPIGAKGAEVGASAGAGRGTVVLGLGNPLLGDDGLGLTVLGRLAEEWDLPPEVELVDGGTWGMSLLLPIEDAERLILVDAIDADRAPGAPITLERNELPLLLHMKLSPHQIDLRDALAVAELRGRLPEHVVALGIQPERVGLGTELSATLEGKVGELTARVVERLEAWGHECRPRG